MFGYWQIHLVARDLTVVRSPFGDVRRRAVITFDHWRDASERKSPVPYAAGFLAKRDIAHINIFAHWNHWFQVEDMAAALEKVRELTVDSAERIVYGSSMGGFGAMQFGDALQASKVIAFAPQYSMDPEKAPFETRYVGDVDRIVANWRMRRPEGTVNGAFIHDTVDAVRLPEQTYVIYDPGLSADAAHVELISRRHKIFSVHVHRSNHWPDKGLRRAGLLGKVIEDILENRMSLGTAFDCPFD